MEEVDEFESTLNWAVEEEKIRATRGLGVSSFYLIIMAVFLLFIFILILYYTNKERVDLIALDMIQDENNIYDDNFTDEPEIEEEDELPEVEPSKETVKEAVKEVKE